ncbi:MAG: rubrerythrin family protein [bacterium]|nr:rubrerythrin family protein [Candidatus Sumerlaeota bacterium]
MATQDNLQAAFAGESQANRKYLAFAKKADQQGFKQAARLFRAIAEAETIHAMSHLRLMQAVKDTADNLQAAIEGETYECTQMYPQFAAEAEREGNRAAVMVFSGVGKVEEGHKRLYEKAFELVKAGKDMADAPVYVCSVCGHIEIGGAPDKCPICGADKDKFEAVS